jgi:hypothetical protein
MPTFNAGPCEPVFEELGYLDVEEVAAFHMPRERYLELVDQAVAKARLQHDLDVGPLVADTAATQHHFPISEWIDEKRGCGCLIGEYLIASNIVARSDWAADIARGDFPHVEELLSREHSAVETLVLKEVGFEIDHLLRAELADVLFDGVHAPSGRKAVVVFDD